ncbi:MAG: LLM class flavin-dependent oxidoreductase [Acidobacteria bacterium]|nr:MAG: LLM class flavin-dependent oxidoreductase [Acidobacteriota bacterium]
MNEPSSTRAIEIYSTCPGTTNPALPTRPGFYPEDDRSYAEKVIEVARWSEECGFTGSLIYIDHSLVDNWSVAQLVLENTTRLVPLIAQQPIYMHPYWCAKKVSTLALLYGRRVALNMVAGAFRNDLLSLGDTTPHDERYARLTEYTRIVLELLRNRDRAVDFEGRYYRIRRLRLHPPLDPDLMPRLLLSGSSEAGMAAARALGAVAVRYPEPVEFYEQNPLERGVRFGLRVGIIAREYEEDAWRIAQARFPSDRKGQLTHQLASKTSDSVWHERLARLEADEPGSYPYWLVPFKNYKTFCPYLVGSYRQVAEILARYIGVGFETIITDIPASKEELLHEKIVFELALARAGARPA